MATLTATATLTDHRDVGLSDADAVRITELMIRTREIDERMWALNRQGKVPFVVPCRGQEAAQAGAAQALDPAKDWLFPHYRDLAFALSFGFTLDELFLMYFAKAADPVSGGRQMTHHWGSQARHVASISSPLATQIPHAVGGAYALRLQGKTDAAVLVSFGEGTASKGDFYEACSLAALHKLPVIFFCQNNLYAISVPMEKQSPVPNVADRAPAFGFPGVIVDGTDPFAIYAAVREARTRGIAGDGPSLIEAKMYRLLPHTSDDNDMTYRTRAEVREAEERECVRRITEYMRERELLTADEIEAMRTRVRAEIAASIAAAQDAAEPDPTTVADRVYAPVEEGVR
jgi:2-oxoisovalerate dehydrogenase E1 component alpha subunit